MGQKASQQPEADPESQQAVWEEAANLPPKGLRALANWIDLVKTLNARRFHQELQNLAGFYWSDLGKQLRAAIIKDSRKSSSWARLGVKLRKHKRTHLP